MQLNIKDVLNKKGLSMYSLAKQTGIPQNTIHNMCNSDMKMTSNTNMLKICKALDCTPNDIFGVHNSDELNKALDRIL